MVSTLVVGVMFSIDVIQAFRALFCARKCQAVHDYGGFNMDHHKVWHKKQLHAHGRVKQVDDVQVQAVSLSTRVQRLVKINRKRRLFFHNHFAHQHRPRHHQAATIHRRAQLDQIPILTSPLNLPLEEQLIQVAAVMPGILAVVVVVQAQQAIRVLVHLADQQAVSMVNILQLDINMKSSLLYISRCILR